MKTLKKLFALVATVATCLSLGATSVLAEGESTSTTGSITINNATGTYAIYQLFKGDVVETTTTEGAEPTKTISNAQWGDSWNEVAKKDAADEGVDAAKAVEIVADYETEADILDFAKIILAKNEDGQYVDMTGSYATAKATKAEGATSATAIFSNLPYGYYLIENTTVASGESYTKYIFAVVGPTAVTINNKTDVPSMTKKVKDTNDSVADSTTGWQDSADYDIGDAVPFQLTGTVASNYADYKTYYFAFHDVEESGLTFDPASVVVKVDGTVITSGYEIKTTKKATNGTTTYFAPTDECTFEVVFSNLKDITSVHAGSVITVDYNSALNESANIGNQGNVNMAKLEFSNNPNEEQSGETKPGTGETPWDNVIVFTYQTVVNKVDQDGKALAGAEFTLEKYDAKNNTWVASKTATLDETGTLFTFKGLDDGRYRLTESKTPAGYNTCAPIEFTVTAEHTIEWDGTNRTAVLTSLKTTGIDSTSKLSDGSLTSNVVNKKGSVLPSTGGIGTTIFYVTGAILMLGAGVLLLSRRNSTSK
jgi:fimbrial isopeptide formation D2 family protein/LPXTG-motif cell wall-anchored protein